MKYTTIAGKAAVAVAGATAAGAFTAAIAAAVPVQHFGSSEQLADQGRTTVTDYTVSNLGPSNTVIPGFVPQGKLWQADVTAVAEKGTTTPLVSEFNARSDNGTTYRVIYNVATPQGLSPAQIEQGGQASGKIYFDVTGQAPDGVVYNDGVEDLLIWTNKV